MLHYTEFKPFSLKLGRKKAVSYIFTLDTEVTSYVTEEGHKQGQLYIWMVGVDSVVYYGRTLLELKSFLTILNTSLKGKEAYMYIHNLAYDFQFLRNIFEFEDVFSRQARKPLKAKIEGTSINLRCSYMLSGMSLESLANTYNLESKKLEFDYNKYRDSNTPLTEEELQYCENDCLIIYQYIRNVELPRWGSLEKIPLTKTGKLRKDFKTHLGNSSRFFASDFSRISAQGVDIHLLLKKAFTGGYIHANPCILDETLEDVESWDITSSYPYVMLTEGFPMGSFYKLENPSLDLINKNQCYLMVIRINDPITIKNFPYLSFSKLNSSYNAELDNGRVISADWVEVTCTEIDLELIKECYVYESIEVKELYVTSKGWLPKKLVSFILDKAKIKQEFKKAYEVDPTPKNKQLLESAKTDLNSIFGMLVTNNLRDEISLDGKEWKTTPMDLERLTTTITTKEAQQDYDMFPYAWGVWVTSYARYNLLHIVYNTPDLEVYYMDTDSLKFKIKEKSDVREAILAYNNTTEAKLLKMLKKFDFDLDSVDLNLGKYKYEGSYKKFRTLGSKKYMYIDKGVLNLRCSGLSRKAVSNFTSIDEFTEGVHINDTGCYEIYYNDNQTGDFRFGIFMQPKEITLSSVLVERPDYKVDSEYYYYL